MTQKQSRGTITRVTDVETHKIIVIKFSSNLPNHKWIAGEPVILSEAIQ